MAVDDIVGIRIVGRYQSQNIVNTMHYKITAQTDTEQTILSKLATAWLTTHSSLWLGRHLAAYELAGVRSFSLTGDNKIPGIVTSGDPGTVVGAATPAPLCRTITMYTDSSNYRRRGRVMLSATDEGDLDDADGSIVSAELAFLVILGDALIDDLTSGGNTFTPGLAPNGVLPFEPFTGVKARKTPALIRSRRVRGFLIG